MLGAGCWGDGAGYKMLNAGNLMLDEHIEISFEMCKISLSMLREGRLR